MSAVRLHFIYPDGYIDIANRDAKSRTRNVVQLTAIVEVPQDVELPGDVYTKFWPIGPPLFSCGVELKQLDEFTSGTSLGSANVISTQL